MVKRQAKPATNPVKEKKPRLPKEPKQLTLSTTDVTSKEVEKQKDVSPFIPLSICPAETKYLSKGKWLHVQVYGVLTENGIEVKEVSMK